MPRPPRSNRAYNKTQYQKNRATILSDKPTCHWCKRRPATEADHLIEQDRGGTNDLDNLVASCKPCNAKRDDLGPEKDKTAQIPSPQPHDHGANRGGTQGRLVNLHQLS